MQNSKCKMQTVLAANGGVKAVSIFTPCLAISSVCILHFALLIQRSLHRVSDSCSKRQRVTPRLCGDTGCAFRADGVDEVGELAPQRLVGGHLQLAAVNGRTAFSTDQAVDLDLLRREVDRDVRVVLKEPCLADA